MNQAPDRFTAAGLNTLERIEQKLAVLSPNSVDLIDDRAKHAAHIGAVLCSEVGSGNRWTDSTSAGRGAEIVVPYGPRSGTTAGKLNTGSP
jgi:hypothetical protein